VVLKFWLRAASISRTFRLTISSISNIAGKMMNLRTRIDTFNFYI